MLLIDHAPGCMMGSLLDALKMTFKVCVGMGRHPTVLAVLP
jgi:altronate dehydratase